MYESVAWLKSGELRGRAAVLGFLCIRMGGTDRQTARSEIGSQVPTDGDRHGAGEVHFYSVCHVTTQKCTKL
jgi:hypothetical protein